MTSNSDWRTRGDVMRYIERTRNWNRWGVDDELGALNLVTPEKRKEAASLVRTGQCLSLARPLPTRPAPNNRYPAIMYMERIEMPPDAQAAKDYQGMSYHGCTATHIDALCHTWDELGMWNGRHADAVIGLGGASWGAIDKWSQGIFTRGVLLDVPAHRGVSFVEDGQPVEGDELFAIAESQNVSIRPGDAVAIYCGREEHDRSGSPWTSDLKRRPGLEATCLRFIRETDLSMVLWDMWDVRPSRFGMGFPVHSAIHAFGVAVVDAALLEPLARTCRERARYDFAIAVNPLNVKGATGSLVNPICFF